MVLIIESHWTEGSPSQTRKHLFPVEQNSTCWEKEKYEVVKDCEPCTGNVTDYAFCPEATFILLLAAFEIASQSIGVCIHTHYKEVLKCASGEMVTRSCDRAAFIDERAFWRFQAFMFFCSVVSTFCVVARKRVLNKRMLQRVQRQLANSV